MGLYRANVAEQARSESRKWKVESRGREGKGKPDQKVERQRIEWHCPAEMLWEVRHDGGSIRAKKTPVVIYFTGPQDEKAKCGAARGA